MGRVPRIPAENQDLPPEPRARVVPTVLDQLEDVTVLVRRPRIGLVHLLGLAGLVAGERAVDLAGPRAGLHVLGPVHLGGAHEVPCPSRVDGDVGLGREPVGRRQRTLTLDEREPLAGAVVVEPRRVEETAVQQRRRRGPVRRVVPVGGHELVEVLEAGVVPHVDHRPTVPRQDHRRALVRVPSERGVLDRGRGRIVGIDLDDPAEPVRLVRLLREVEPVLVEAPGHVPAPPRNAVSSVELPGARVGGLAPEVVVDVLLGGEDRAPGRDTAGAVVQCPQDPRAGRIRAGPHERVPRRRSPEHHGRGACDPAVQGRVPHDAPLAPSAAHDLDHGEAVRGDLDLAHLPGPLGLPVPGGPHQLRARVLVVHAEKAARRPITPRGKGRKPMKSLS